MGNNYKSVSSALVVSFECITSWRISDKTVHFTTRSLPLMKPVIGKFTFRISHDEFRMSLERSNCGYSFKITLSFLSENYYTEAAKIIKKPLAALPPNIQSSHKRELHIQRHLPWMLSLLKDVCWLSWSSNFDESLFFSVREAWIFGHSQNFDNK